MMVYSKGHTDRNPSAHGSVRGITGIPTTTLATCGLHSLRSRGYPPRITWTAAGGPQRRDAHIPAHESTAAAIQLNAIARTARKGVVLGDSQDHPLCHAVSSRWRERSARADDGLRSSSAVGPGPDIEPQQLATVRPDSLPSNATIARKRWNLAHRAPQLSVNAKMTPATTIASRKPTKIRIRPTPFRRWRSKPMLPVVNWWSGAA